MNYLRWRRRERERERVRAVIQQRLDEDLARERAERLSRELRRAELTGRRERIPQEERWPSTDIGRRVLRVVQSAAMGGECSCPAVWIENEGMYLKRCRVSEEIEKKTWGSLSGSEP